METFKIGDVIQLKSGGPDMTVTDPKIFSGSIRAVWFSGRKLEHGDFPPGAIQHVKAEDQKK